MIFGGSFSEIITTEVWNFTTGDYREIQPELSSGEFWNSILFLVENDFCKIKSWKEPFRLESGSTNQKTTRVFETLTPQGQSSERNLPGTIVPWRDIFDKW